MQKSDKETLQKRLSKIIYLWKKRRPDNQPIKQNHAPLKKEEVRQSTDRTYGRFTRDRRGNV